MAGVYVHVPFCWRKCLYCDFYSVGERLAHWPEFVSAILAEAADRLPESSSSVASETTPDRTLYIGGGTPSLIPDTDFLRLADGLLLLTGSVREFTIEVNPDDVTAEKARVWRRSGVNRVSMGVQSLIDAELQAIGRRHDAGTARRAFEILRSEFDNISLDVMFGLPGQTLRSFGETLDGLLAMNPEHISAYSLMYEERTALTRMRDAGKIEEAPEDMSREMFRTLSRRLSENGYEHYEISNYARPGRRSIHNSAYWQGELYVGLGPGAHSYDGLRTRRANQPDVAGYIRYWNHGEGGRIWEVERLTDEEMREEYIMTRMRTREGISLSDYESRFGERAGVALERQAATWIANGSLHLDDGHLSFTLDGLTISDYIMVSLF